MRVSRIIIPILLLHLMVAAQEPKRVSIILERSVAQVIWEKGVSESPKVFEAMKTALRERHTPEEAAKFLIKRCRDFGDGPSFECTNEMVELEMSEETAVEWLSVLTSEQPTKLSDKAGKEIFAAFHRAGFK